MGPLNVMLGDGGDQYTRLDRFGRIVDQQWLTNGTATDRFQYGYDADSNVLWRSNLVNTAFSELYHAGGSGNGYDNFNRLVEYSRGTLSSDHTSIQGTAAKDQTFTLDQLGNWATLVTSVNGTPTTQTRSVNLKNQYTAISGQFTPTFDHNGNTTSDDTGKQYVYDPWNRIVKVKDYSGNLLQTYGYMAGQRDTDVTTNVCTGYTADSYYSADGQDVEDDVTLNVCPGNLTVSTYAWGAGYVNDLIERDQGALRTYVQQDSNYDVTALINSSGTVTERFDYDPYGTRSTLTAAWNGTLNDTGWVYSFQGGRYDPTSGLIHFGARDLSTTMGRWMQQDPSGYVDGLDLYQLEKASTIGRLDPTGLDSSDDWWWWSWLAPGAWLYYTATRESRANYRPPDDDHATGDNILYEYFNEVGPQHRHFGNKAFLTDILKAAPAVSKAREKAMAEIDVKQTTPFDFYQPHTSPFNDVPDMIDNRFDQYQGATGFIGGYTGRVRIEKLSTCHFRIHFHAYNKTSRESGGAGPENRPVDQTWDWDEDVHLSRNAN